MYQLQGGAYFHFHFSILIVYLYKVYLSFFILLFYLKIFLLKGIGTSLTLSLIEKEEEEKDVWSVSKTYS